jgi:hypothetical protein
LVVFGDNEMVLVPPNVLINNILFQSFQSFSNPLVFKALRTKIIFLPNGIKAVFGSFFGVFRGVFPMTLDDLG